MAIKQAYFASGCFWGTEYFFENFKGVKSAISGYMGGNMINPDYHSVCTGLTGHLETVKVEYDDEVVSYEELVKQFFETHDFTQTNGQGPDIGSQYLSAIFYTNDNEKNICEKYIEKLQAMGYKVATKLYKEVTFYEAEEYHQDYYERHQKVPYCHFYRKIF